MKIFRQFAFFGWLSVANFGSIFAESMLSYAKSLGPYFEKLYLDGDEETLLKHYVANDFTVPYGIIETTRYYTAGGKEIYTRVYHTSEKRIYSDEVNHCIHYFPSERTDMVNPSKTSWNTRIIQYTVALFNKEKIEEKHALSNIIQTGKKLQEEAKGLEIFKKEGITEANLSKFDEVMARFKSASQAFIASQEVAKQYDVNSAAYKQSLIVPAAEQLRQLRSKKGSSYDLDQDRARKEEERGAADEEAKASGFNMTITSKRNGAGYAVIVVFMDGNKEVDREAHYSPSGPRETYKVRSPEKYTEVHFYLGKASINNLFDTRTKAEIEKGNVTVEVNDETSAYLHDW